MDNKGGVDLVSGGGDSISMTKATKTIALDASVAINSTAATTKITALTSHTVTAGKVDITASGGVNVTATGSIAQTAASVTITAGSITLGAGALPIVKHTPWLPGWTGLVTELAKQTKTYTGPVPPPPPTVSVTDYLLLLTKLNIVASAFAATTTVITKAS